MERYSRSLVSGIVLLAVGFVPAIYGYFYALIYMLYPLFILIAVLILISLPPEEHRTVSTIFACITIISFFAVSGVGTGTLYLALDRWAICRTLQPLTEELDSYERKHGAYPAHLSRLKTDVPGELTVRQVNMSESGSSYVDYNSSDAIFYLWENKYAVVVPVSKMLPMSFTRYYYFVRRNSEENWKYKKSIWYIRAYQ